MCAIPLDTLVIRPTSPDARHLDRTSLSCIEPFTSAPGGLGQALRSWAVQSAGRNVSHAGYQLVVSHGSSPVWDTGKVVGEPFAQSTIAYGGTTQLEQDTSYSWKARWWSSDPAEAAAGR
jgi:hypothetical protein